MHMVEMETSEVETLRISLFRSNIIVTHSYQGEPFFFYTCWNGILVP
jgi:hypothetical protein